MVSKTKTSKIICPSCNSLAKSDVHSFHAHEVHNFWHSSTPPFFFLYAWTFPLNLDSTTLQAEMENYCKIHVIYSLDHQQYRLLFLNWLPNNFDNRGFFL